MKALQIATQNQTMTLKEITDLLDVQHSKAMLIVEKMAQEPEFGTVSIMDTVYNKKGQTIETYKLDKRQSIAVSARLNTALMMRIIDRWQELESNQTKALPSYAETLRLYADSLEELEKAKPMIDFDMRVRRLDGSCSVGEFAKAIGTGRSRLFNKLREDGLLMINNQPYQSQIERGLFVVIEQTPYTDRQGKSHPAFKIMITGKGQVYLEKKYKRRCVMELRPYQTKLIDDIRHSIAAGHRHIICQLYVGGGKTVIASEIINGAKKKLKRSLFLAPRRQLVYQTVETLNKFGINSGLIMAGESPFSQPMAQVGSFDTITSRVKSERMQIPEAAFVLVDECHATMSKARLELLSHYPIVIGLTSTPALANGKGMGCFYTDIVQGPSMAEMVEGGFLVPMRYFGADAPDLAKVKLNSDGDYQETSLAEATDKPELIGSIYDNYKKIAGDRTTLIFAVNCAHARHIHDEFKRHGVTVEYIDGSTPTEEREEIKQRVESGQSKVIVNIGVMAFGTDWPIISCVIVARATKNISAWIQMLGRGSRLHPGKKDCLVIYHGDNFDELGRIDDPIEWSLDDKTTIKERKAKAQQERKEPKDIKCKCGYVFRSSRVCPSCQLEIIPKGEAIPFHKADLVEIAPVKKPSPAEKAQFYAELLGYSRSYSKPDSYALALFKAKFDEWPYNKHSAQPVPPSIGTMTYVQSRNIVYANRRAAA